MTTDRDLAAAMGFAQPSNSDPLRQGDDAITLNAQLAARTAFARRSLGNGEDMNRLTLPGLYWTNSYAVSNSLLNGPRMVGAVDRAAVEVTANAVGQTFQRWVALSAASSVQPPIVSRRRDSSGDWSEWESDRWTKRELTSGENMNDLVIPGIYWVPNYTIANSLVNGSRVRNSVGHAMVEVTANKSGYVHHKWTTINPASIADSPVAARRRDDTGAWTGWTRIDASGAADPQAYSGLSGVGTHQAQEGTLRLIAGMTEDRGEPWRWVAPAGTQLVTPTHEGSGQATHPSVLYFPDKWNGWHYWMGMTPYPWGNEDHEDPDILVSDDGDTWQVPTGLVNPLDNQPGAPGPHNSDTHLVMLPDGRMMLTWRMVDRPNGSTNVFYQRISSDGTTWTQKREIFRATATTGFVSQALVRVGNKWRMYGVASGSIIYYESTATVPGPNDWSDRITAPNSGAGNARRWWHLDVQHVNGKWWMLVADVRRGSTADGNLYLGVSDDGHTWEISPTPIVPKVAANHDTLYKAGFVVNAAGTSIDIYYSAFRRDSIEWRIYRTTANKLTPFGDGPQPTQSTGLRDITAMFPEVTSGTIELSRVDTGVTLSLYGVAISSAEGSFHHLSARLPDGFWPLPGVRQMVPVVHGTGMVRLRVISSGQVTIYNHDGASLIYGSLFYSTVDDWPTTLPGTPV